MLGHDVFTVVEVRNLSDKHASSDTRLVVIHDVNGQIQSEPEAGKGHK